MAKQLDAETRRKIAERIRYHREMGIHDFYKREVAVETQHAASLQADDDSNDVPQAAIAHAAGAALGAHADRIAQLRAIREDIGDCTRCALHKLGRTKIVFGVGNPEAELMFIGEGPGADEDAQGEPFVGRAGQLLNKMIEAMGLKREDVYIANVVKCRPPGNRTPEKEECDTCLPFLMRQIEVIQPRIIVALGAVAAKNLLGLNDAMARLRGRLYDFSPPRSLMSGASAWEGCKLAVTYHPAYLLRDPRQKAEAWKDLQMVMNYLDLSPPARAKS
jgi:uracil-DNA glycosylase family 4